MIDNPDDLATDLLQASPAIAVSGITFLGFPLHEWVYILTIIYTIICIASVIKKHWVDPYINNNNNKNKEESRDSKEDNGRQEDH